MIRHYLVLATKVLLRRKFFTSISLFGIAATLVVFVVIAAFLDHGFGPGAPETKQDRMLAVQRAVMWGEGFQMSSHAGYKLFNTYARDLPGVERLTIFSNSGRVDSFLGGEKRSVWMKFTDGEFWRVFDFTFTEGRPYDEADVANGEFVAVLSESARRRLLGDGAALDAMVDVDGRRFRVVGVVADVSEMRVLPFSEMWVPHTTEKTSAYRDQLMGRYQAVVLGASRDALPGIRAEFNSRLGRVDLPTGVQALVAPFETRFEGFARQMQLGDVRSPDSQAANVVAALTLFGVLLAFLPAVNLVNLNVSRILERASEIGVRKAFGASSRRLVVQFVVENVLLTVTASLLAFVLAGLLLGAINRSGVIAHAALGINLRVFAVGVVLAVAFGIASGVYPAWRMSRLHPVDALKGHTR
jgi:putative ABC transport system permease protein